MVEARTVLVEAVPFSARPANLGRECFQRDTLPFLFFGATGHSEHSAVGCHPLPAFPLEN